MLLLSNHIRVHGQSMPNQSHLWAYLRVQEPEALSEILSSPIPEVFQQTSFSIYLLSTPGSPLEWILCSKEEDSAAWREISTEKNWSFMDISGYRLFYSESSKLKEEVSVIEFLEIHLGADVSSGISGGLLPGWNAGLKRLYDDAPSRIQLFDRMFPEMVDHSVEYADYLQWIAQELMSINSLILNIDPLGEDRKVSLRMSTVPGTRLYRLLSRKVGGSQAVLDFVPSNAESLVYGSIDGIFAGNYMNYHFKATNVIDHDLFQTLRFGVNQLDAGVIDRWDGSWATWTPKGSEAKQLLLGGDFQSSDLGELFDMFSLVDLSGTRFSIQLDEENSIVGFSRIRSLDLYDNQIQDIEDSKPMRRYFFCVAQGFLIISDSDSELIDLAFKINSRSLLKDSAKSLVAQDSTIAMSRIENGHKVGSLQMNDGRIFYQQEGRLELANYMVTRIINILN